MTDDELIYKGAEANLYRTSDGILKQRVSKKYRIPEIDESVRKLRTRHEAKILEKLHAAGVSVPKVLKASESDKTILLEDVGGETLKDVISNSNEKQAQEYARKIGGLIKKTHEQNFVHNDLTTSNMIYDGKKIFLIDWGLGYHTTRLEDKAMDLVVFRKSLRATHPKKSDLIWDAIIEGYGRDHELFERVEQIEGRVRYA